MTIERIVEEARRQGMSYGQYVSAVSHAKRGSTQEEPREASRRFCRECGRPIPPDALPNRKYCSQVCREAAARRQHRGYYYNRRDRKAKDDQRHDTPQSK